MKYFMHTLAFLLAGTLLLMAQGTYPPREVTDYPACLSINGIGLGASVLKEAQLKQRLVSEISKDFLVLEVAIYPGDGGQIKIQRDKFGLRVGLGKPFRPENPEIVAASAQKSSDTKPGVAVVPHVGVGYESGRVYDPATGTYRNGGIYTSTGVLVMSDPGTPADPRDRDTMALELSEKGLPQGDISKPVAGYLYFRVDKKIQKDSKTKYSLLFDLNGKENVLELKR